MADVFSKEKRSEVMSKIRGKDTKPEILVRKYLHSRGLRFRKNDKRYPGHPDIVLPKYKTIISMKDASMQEFPNPMWSTGRTSSMATEKEISAQKKN